MNHFKPFFPQALYLSKKNQAYLDSAATTLKPKCVIDTLQVIYTEKMSNIHRGDHYLSNQMTLEYENTRTEVKNWIGAKETKEIIFTKSATESLNLLSFALEDLFQTGDEILLTELEHHSNILPWQALAKKKNLKLKFLPVHKDTGELLLSKWDSLVTSNTKLLAFTYYSNALGLRSPVEDLIKKAKKNNILTVVDAAQAMTAEPVNVQKLNCDFLVFSGHKVFSPTGVGVLYIQQKHFKNLKLWQKGGGMITDVRLSGYDPAPPPHCFEAGTPSIEAVLALGAVLSFLKENSFFSSVSKTKALLEYANQQLKPMAGLRQIGSSQNKTNIISFTIEGIHPRDLGHLISKAGVALRSGHHCCLPLMKKMNLLSGTVRISFSIYNDDEDIDLLTKAIKKATKILS